jgi:excisionase family DNA binding protein
VSEPLLVKINDAAAMIGKSRRSMYSLIGAGRLKAVKSGRNTLIAYQSLKEYVASLPVATAKFDDRAKRHVAA